MGLGDDPINKIAQSIEKIQKDVHALSSGFSHFQVDTYTSEDREKIKLERQK